MGLYANMKQNKGVDDLKKHTKTKCQAKFSSKEKYDLCLKKLRGSCELGNAIKNKTIEKKFYIAQQRRSHRQDQVNQVIQPKPQVAKIVNAALQDIKWNVIQYPSYS